ncbi:DinB family protein [Mucilaginibacter sp.]|uniref:DinB family protein n=1 Tax=Mucilaginibacter sp. TaxID=1882438 RepID=UPI0032662BF2
MIQQAINEYKTATDNFLKVLGMFNQQQFNTVPFEGSWTPAQVADHMLKSQWGLPEVLTGNTKPADRKPDAGNAFIENIFLDFSTKLKSPEFILPTEEPQNKAEVLSKYNDKSEEIQQTFKPLNPTDICLDFEIPGSGPFTRLEWLHFVACHTIRHTRQLENIHQVLVN